MKNLASHEILCSMELVVGLVDCLVGWLVGWLVVWLVGCSDNQPVSQLLSWLVG